jgi:hypothetical protein
MKPVWGPLTLCVTRGVMNLVEEGSSCFFVATKDLRRYRGNKTNKEKMQRLCEQGQDTLLHHDSRLGERSLPTLVINCARGTCVLIEGNHRHELFVEFEREWFPVYVRVEDYETVDIKWPCVEKWDWPREELPLWKKKKVWEDNLGVVLFHIFSIRVLEID